MNAPDRIFDWSEANQHLLVAEFARLRALLGDGDAVVAATQAEALRAAMPAPAAIDTLTQLFQLSAFERDLVLLAAGVEMDARIGALCGQGSGQPQRPWASFGLSLAALSDAHWSALAPLEPLRRWRLIEVDEAAGLTAARLKLDERVLHFIGGLNYLDHRLQPLLDPVPPPGPMSEAHREIAAHAVERLRTPPRGPAAAAAAGRRRRLGPTGCRRRDRRPPRYRPLSAARRGRADRGRRARGARCAVGPRGRAPWLWPARHARGR